MGVLDGKGAVVTGGSRGIGRAIVQRLVRDGAHVVFCYLSDADAAKAVEEATGGWAHGVRVDLGEPTGVDRLFESADARLDGLDVLVNNAGSAVRPVLLRDLTDAEFEQLMTVNATATFRALRHAARHMRDGGRIVNVSTLNTVMHGPGIAAYAASKGAVEQLTAVAAKELGARGITVNTVSPGATDTDMLRGANTEEGLATMPGVTALGRLGRPEDVADVVAFLCGPDGRWMTGQNLHATGGLYE
jgi:3-oxoacyl-[acyl-carrier protein] reductase